MKIALALEYNGASFHGWQSQPGGNTLQDAVEQALSQVAGEQIRVHAAGRTDAGVHATLMPAHFETGIKRQASAWVNGGNACLPPPVKILWAKPVAAAFHARFHAERRYYRYILLNRATPPALLGTMVGYCHIPLDIAAMRQASRYLRGEHDFSTFRAAACQAKTAVRQLYQLRIRKKDDWVIFDFCGNAFLHHMLRNIVGTLLVVGRKRQPPRWLRDLLTAGDRTLAAPTMAANGLYFTGAEYHSRYRLPPCYRATPLA